MAKYSYEKKALIFTRALPVVAVLVFAGIGYRATRASQAESLPATGISIASDQPVYKLGDTVKVTLSNASDDDVYVQNHCPEAPLAVYRQVQGKWQALSASANQTKCEGEPHDYAIRAHTSIKTDYRYWPILFTTPGHYRIVADIEERSGDPMTEFNVTQ